MQLLTVAFNAIFALMSIRPQSLKKSVFSSLLYQAARPKIVIPGYIVKKTIKKSQCLLHLSLFYATFRHKTM